MVWRGRDFINHPVPTPAMEGTPSTIVEIVLNKENGKLLEEEKL